MKRTVVICALLLGVTRVAQATPVYTCPGGSTQCAGQTFAVWISATGSGFFDINVSIDTTGYNGATPAYASGVEFKNVTDSNDAYTAISLTAAPGGPGHWLADTGQLSQDCLATASFNDTGCAYWNGLGGTGFGFAIGEILTWTFHVLTPDGIGDAVAHFKYQYQDANGRQIAGLLSQDIALQEITTVPEPASLLLLGTGLLSALRVARRRHT